MQILANILVPLLGDLWESLTPILFLLLYGIFQLITGKAEAKKNAPRPRKPQAPKPVQGPDGRVAQANAPPNQADSLRREVEDFLRRAQGEPPKKEEEFAPVTLETPSKRQPPRQTLDRQTMGRQGSPEQRLTKQRRTTQADRPQPEMRREGVAEHVARHVQSSTIAAHAESLGAAVEHADDRMESHLHEKFDHRLGSLGHQADSLAVTTKKKNLAAEIAQLLSKPEGMRQLIVAQEILRRPERW